jgi:hypothetical protein
MKLAGFKFTRILAQPKTRNSSSASNHKHTHPSLQFAVFTHHVYSLIILLNFHDDSLSALGIHKVTEFL